MRTDAWLDPFPTAPPIAVCHSVAPYAPSPAQFVLELAAFTGLYLFRLRRRDLEELRFLADHALNPGASAGAARPEAAKPAAGPCDGSLVSASKDEAPDWAQEPDLVRARAYARLMNAQAAVEEQRLADMIADRRPPVAESPAVDATEDREGVAVRLAYDTAFARKLNAEAALIEAQLSDFRPLGAGTKESDPRPAAVEMCSVTTESHRPGDRTIKLTLGCRDGQEHRFVLLPEQAAELGSFFTRAITDLASRSEDR